jgi:hypothetical protein
MKCGFTSNMKSRLEFLEFVDLKVFMAHWEVTNLM